MSRPLPDPSIGIRDKDLLERLEQGRGSIVFDVIARGLEREQAERDRLAALPRDARRRAKTRAQLDLGPPNRDDLRHIHSVLALCSLPYTRQPLEKREWQRDVGRMSLIIEAGKLQAPNGQWVEQPLPYGSRARLLLIHLCSEAVRQKSAQIEIEDSLTGFVRAMGFPVTGGKNGTLQSFKTQVNALAACHMRIGMSDGIRAQTVNTQPFSSIDVWFPSTPDQRMLWPSTITFSQDFFATLTKHALPVNIHAVRDFAGSPRKLDMLFWLGYRLNHLAEPLVISWNALQDQWGQGYSRASNFKRDFAQEIAEIKEVFPKLPFKLTEEGAILEPAGGDVLALPQKRPARR